MPTYPEPAVLYPEVAVAGSLAAALRDVVAELGLAVPVPVGESESLYSAVVPAAVAHREELEVSASRVERLWYVTGRERAQGFTVIGGETPDLAQVARAAQGWHDGAALAGIVEAASFMELTGRSEWPGSEPAQMAEAEWEQLRREAAELALKWTWPEYEALVEAAYAEPRLRQLYPFTTHVALRFSTRTRPALDIVPVCLHAGRGPNFSVTRGFVADEDGPLATAATAEEAVALAVRHLPPGIGPATSGDPDALDRQRQS
ncbi:DUF6193 family natural product biosynthesis protein [Dactylosporangium sp. McL0621]|uniref:DUF6193 family natural product biosynthesis protein n=1 Tax=Dactylosporangium sp. McL0621 TaxID=3415678 RepID=UPI003CE9C89D